MQSGYSRAYRGYLLVVLLLIFAFNLVDRFALGVVLQDIKTDLGLSDTQLGFMSGIAFAAFYAVMGVPIALWADRGNRVAIISLSTALWSVAVSLCGAVGSFIQLLLVRVGVAVGEAGAVAPASSIIGDFYARAERPRAMAIYQLGGPLSLVLGYSLSGWLNELYGWRVMFILLGIPGVALALLARFTLKEPRARVSARTAARPSPPSLADVVRTLWSNTTFCHVLLCLSVMFFFVYGIQQWQPTFFIRSYSLTSAQIGVAFAAVYGAGGLIGTYLGGAWASKHAAGNECLQLKGMALTLAASAVFATGTYLSRSASVSLVLMGGQMLALTAINGPVLSIVQTLVPENMRAVAIALVLMFANLIGMGLGPLAAGALSDAFRPWAGEESLRFALLALGPGLLWAAWHAWRASRCFSEHENGLVTSGPELFVMQKSSAHRDPIP